MWLTQKFLAVKDKYESTAGSFTKLKTHQTRCVQHQTADGHAQRRAGEHSGDNGWTVLQICQGHTDGRMDTNERTNGLTHGQTYWHTHRHRDTWTHRRADRQTHRQTDGWTDTGTAHGQRDGQTETQIHEQTDRHTDLMIAKNVFLLDPQKLDSCFLMLRLKSYRP